MNQVINAALDSRWERMRSGVVFYTPDVLSGKKFSILSIDKNLVRIEANGGTNIDIARAAFAEVIRYLVQNMHTVENPCPIVTGREIAKAGPLCLAARKANGSNVAIINYVLPLLSIMGFVGVDGTRPNKTWLK